MLFSSITFLFLFLPIMLAVYYIAPPQWKNLLLLAGSLIFYAWGEPVYIILMILSILLNYFCGMDIENKSENEAKAKRSLVFAITVNIVLLVFFKYFGFLVESTNTLFGISIPYRELALPIGISFYTFQEISYIVDVYRGKVKAQQSLVKYALYVSMFPQLVAGPIVCYGDIEKQLTARKISGRKLGQGAMLFIIGLSKKAVLANTLGKIFEEISSTSASNLTVLMAWLGCITYAFQIYFDFSGYSDMAIGLGRMFGFEFKKNFDVPYISKSITEFWRRWHMTLGAWFRDYVFYPLSLSKFFSRLGKKCRGIFGNYIGKLIPVLIPQFIIFFLIGIWHGAEWKYIAFGCYNGTLIVLGILFEQPLQKLVKRLAIRTDCISWRIFQVLRTLILVAIGKIITRAPGVSAAKYMITSMIKNWNMDVLLEGGLLTMGLDVKDLWVLFLSCLVLLSVSLMQESGIRVRETLAKQNLYFRWVIYLGALFSLILFGVYGLNYNAADFIYRGF